MTRITRTGKCRGQQAKHTRLREDVLVGECAEHYGPSACGVLPILQEIALRRGALTPNVLGATADATGTYDAQVAGIASFYSMLPDFKKVAGDTESGTPIRVCDGPVCMLHGADQLKDSLQSKVCDDECWCVQRTSCLGLCDRAPAVLVGNEPCGSMNTRRIPAALAGWRGPPPNYGESIVGERRVAMARVGRIDPTSLSSAIQAGAYQPLKKAIAKHPADVLAEVKRSGLRGCGGAGFPTGEKWQLVAEQESSTKYIICNADESEPGAFKDRVLMENDPHSVLEGMALAGFAVGANSGIIYVRGEYQQSADLLEHAINEAGSSGYLGERIDGSDFSFQIRVHRGSGAYICGEETALLESLEGKRGEPRLRPPYPTQHGFLGHPTVLNNVETLCMIPPICEHGGTWYRDIGPPEAPGKKLFTLSGHIRRPTVFESPLRVSVRDILNRVGLGMRSGSDFKMALTGGAAGTFVPKALLDVPIDFESASKGVALGSGVIIVFDTTVSVPEVLEWLLHFFRQESCGKCTPCREGSIVAHDIVERIARNEGRPGDINQLRHLAELLQQTSFCGLGQSIALPINSAIDHFPEDFQQCGAT